MIRKLLDRYGVPYVADGHHSHNTAGWVNVHCPFCRGTPNFHLGILENGTGANCWRCGSHSVAVSLSRVLGIPQQEVRRLLQQTIGPTGTRKRTEPKVEALAFRFPKPHSKLKQLGKRYLENRGYDPDYLENVWGLFQTGPVSFLDGISYANRIVAPLTWNGRVVSFQARDITGHSNVKYLACPKGRERVHHKHIVYGKQGYSDIRIIVEGPADVWRLGESAVATMGIKFTMEQVLSINELSEQFIILYDAEKQAQMQARKLASKLKTLGKRTVIERLPTGDPGDLAQDDADHLVRQLTRRVM